jgi:hypothetical protein
MVVIARDLAYVKTRFFSGKKSNIFLAQSSESIHKPHAIIAWLGAKFFERGR